MNALTSDLAGVPPLEPGTLTSSRHVFNQTNEMCMRIDERDLRSWFDAGNVLILSVPPPPPLLPPQGLCTFISAASKLAQLQCLWRTKEAEQVSALTWAMASYTCLGGYWWVLVGLVVSSGASNS